MFFSSSFRSPHKPFLNQSEFQHICVCWLWFVNLFACCAPKTCNWACGWVQSLTLFCLNIGYCQIGWMEKVWKNVVALRVNIYTGPQTSNKYNWICIGKGLVLMPFCMLRWQQEKQEPEFASTQFGQKTQTNDQFGNSPNSPFSARGLMFSCCNAAKLAIIHKKL